MELTGGKPILEILPFARKKVGIVTTGNEVWAGRIQDTFTPVILEKHRVETWEQLEFPYQAPQVRHIDVLLTKVWQVLFLQMVRLAFAL